MKYTITQGQVGTRPPVEKPNPAILEQIGEKGVRQLVSDHYDILRVSEITNLFPKEEDTFEKAKQHSADFFIQIMGGPTYFNQNRGQPMMAMRHAPFKINQKARKIWLESYALALEKSNLNEDLKESYWRYIDIFSIWMLNSIEE